MNLRVASVRWYLLPIWVLISCTSISSIANQLSRGAKGDQSAPAAGHHSGVQDVLGAAFVTSASAESGQMLDLQLIGTGLQPGDTIQILGPGKIVITDESNIQITGSQAAEATLRLKAPLDPSQSYKVHLISGNRVRASVALDLEFLVRAQMIAELAPNLASLVNDPERTFSSSDSPSQKKKKAKQIDKDLQSSQEFMHAVLKAAESERQMYLQTHPEISPVTLSPYGVTVTGEPNSTADTYCQPDSTAESAYIHVRRSLVDPKEASDSYGRRLGRRFLVFEVTVENTNPNLQYMLHDVSVDLSRLHNTPPGTFRWAFSSQDLIMLRGVPEKGTDYDPRNLTLHIARGMGSVAGGVTGLTSEGIQELYGGAVAAFNGPTLTSYLDILPDHTATQLNRLSDSAFTANTVVAKQSAKTFAIFVPETLFLSKKEQKSYWKQPSSLFDTPWLDFRQADVCVDGAFISEVPALTLASASFDDPDAVGDGTDQLITVAGTNLAVGDTIVNAFGTTFEIASATNDGSTAHAKLNIPKGYDLSISPVIWLESKKTGFRTPAVSLALAPLLKSVDYLKSTFGKGTQATLAITADRIRADGELELLFGGDAVAVAVDPGGHTGTVVVTLADEIQAQSNIPVRLRAKSTGIASASSALQFKSPELTSVGFTDKSALDHPGYTLAIQGAHLVYGDTEVVILKDGSTEVDKSDVNIVDGSTGSATFKVDPPNGNNLTVVLRSKKFGGSSKPQPFPVAK